MNDEWDKQFEEFEIDLSDPKVYKEEFMKYFYKINWKE